MYNLLKGKKGIILGALDENSIAWKTAVSLYLPMLPWQCVWDK